MIRIIRGNEFCMHSTFLKQDENFLRDFYLAFDDKYTKESVNIYPVGFRTYGSRTFNRDLFYDFITNYKIKILYIPNKYIGLLKRQNKKIIEKRENERK